MKMLALSPVLRDMKHVRRILFDLYEAAAFFFFTSPPDKFIGKMPLFEWHYIIYIFFFVINFLDGTSVFCNDHILCHKKNIHTFMYIHRFIARTNILFRIVAAYSVMSVILWDICKHGHNASLSSSFRPNSLNIGNEYWTKINYLSNAIVMHRTFKGHSAESEIERKREWVRDSE